MSSGLLRGMAMAAVVGCGLVAGAAPAREMPVGWSLAAPDPAFNMPVPGIRPADLRARDANNKVEAGGPVQFAEPWAVSATPWNDGVWDLTPSGEAVWRLRIHAPGATDLNMTFSEFELPEGARLFLYNEESNYVQGPYTAVDNNAQRQLWTAVVPGEEAVIELVVAPERMGDVRLQLGAVNRGYRALLESDAVKQGSCNIDVICSEGNGWRPEIRSVATYSFGGSLLCTGTLVMNTRADFRPFFLTAYHCGVTEANAASVVVYWNYQAPTCGQLSGGSLAQNQSGARFHARSRPSDFCLIELNRLPAAAVNAHYAGWERSGVAPSAVVCIHHPNTDEKAISFENQAVQSAGYLSDTVNASADHWRVLDWDLGTTEPGSSGSGLWNANTHRLIGQLHGGEAACGNNLSDWYGKISVSWEGGGTDSTRLRPWLDPDNTGATGVDGRDGAPLWAGATSGGNGWKRVTGFGWFYDTGTGWINHETLGWMFADPQQSPTSIWMMDSDPTIGWFWTSQSSYPWVYRGVPAGWLYYQNGSTGPRWFWNASNGQWESH